MRCPHCNAELTEGAAVCPNCGAQLAPAPPAVHVPYSQQAVAGKKTQPWVWVIVGVAACFCVCPVFGALLFPVFAQARLAAIAKVEMSHARLVDLGVAMYANDWDNRLPSFTDTGKLAEALTPYLHPYKAEGYVANYEWNKSLSEKLLTKVPSPATTWLLRTPEPDGAGKIIVGFADQSVKRVNLEAFDSTKAQP